MIPGAPLVWRATKWITWTAAKLTIAFAVVFLIAQAVTGEDTGLDWLVQIGERVLFYALSLTAA